MRDENCRLSGILREKKDWTDEELERIMEAGLPVAKMQVAHGLPFGMSETVCRPNVVSVCSDHSVRHFAWLRSSQDFRVALGVALLTL